MRAGEAFLATFKNDPDAQRWWHSDERRRKWEEFQAEIERRVAAGHGTWQHFVGTPMPTTIEEVEMAAVEFGLPADVILRGDFKLADVTTFMVGKRRAAFTKRDDRVRAAAAEEIARMAVRATTPAAAVTEGGDKDYAWASANFSSTDWRILEVCIERGFTDREHAQSSTRITQFVAGSNGRPAKGECGDLRRNFDRLKARGFLEPKRGIGTFATAKAMAVYKARKAHHASAARTVPQG